MVNSAGVVGPDYLPPVDVDGSTATHADVAQILVNMGLITDTSETFTPPDGPRVVGPDYLRPIEGDFETGGLAEAMIEAGILTEDPDTRDPGDPVGPDYLRPIEITLAGITEADFVTAMAEAGYFNDTSA